MAVAYLGLDREQIAHASVLIRVAQQIGGSFGTAVLAVILAHTITAGHPADAFHQSFWWATAFTAAAALLALALPGKPAPTPPAPNPTTPSKAAHP